MCEKGSPPVFDVCDICGRGVPDGDLMIHQTEKHGQILAIRERCEEDSGRAFIGAMIPGIILFLIISFVSAAFLPVEHQYLILLGFIPILVSGLLAARASDEKMAPYQEALKSVEFVCEYCETPVSKGEYQSHLLMNHRGVYRRLRALLGLLILIPVSSTLSCALVLSEYLLLPTPDALLWSSGLGVATALSWAVIVEYVLFPRMRRAACPP